MNHLEQLVTEWLQFNGYFVRSSVLVGRRAKGGFEGELDVVGLHMGSGHFIHVECSLDALSDEKRQAKFKTKFERGRNYKNQVFQGMVVPEELEQVAILQLTGTKERTVGGVRAITVRDLIHEITGTLIKMPPMQNAVPSNYPLLRTLQLAADATRVAGNSQKLLTHQKLDAKAAGTRAS